MLAVCRSIPGIGQESVTGMFKFKDFNPAAIARLVNPPRKQISLLQMLGNHKIMEYFSVPRRAVAFTPASRPFQGELFWNGSDFQFNCPEGTIKILNKQLLVISFTLEGVEHYTQIEAKLIFAYHFILAALPLRYYKRYEIQSSLWMYPVSYDDLTALITGDISIRRTQREADAGTGIHYFLREQVVKNTGEHVEDYGVNNSQILPGKLIEVSQGGCCLRLQRDCEEVLRSARLLYLTTTFFDGRKSGNISCFGAIRKLTANSQGLIIRCSFLEAMPLEVQGLKNGVGSYDLRFEENAKFTLNGQRGEAVGIFAAEMPLGHNVLRVKWARGTEMSYQLLITSRTPRELVISPERGVVDQVLPLSG